MKLPIYQVDAFCDAVFHGNPAAVCPLPAGLPDVTLQAIAMENNLSETAFLMEDGERMSLRWFTPTTEVDLCGHATLASAWVLFHELGWREERIVFHTRSGELTARRDGDGIELRFPAVTPRPCAEPPGLLAALGLDTGQVLAADDYIVVLDDAARLAELCPDFQRLRGFPKRGVAVTARGEDCDFVSRWFGPGVGVDEDPVTGSAHCWLAPYWAGVLGKTRLLARQGGARRGSLECRVEGEEVALLGQARLYLKGEIYVQSDAQTLDY